MIATILAGFFFIGDSHTVPLVGGADGPGYVEIIDDSIGGVVAVNWYGCGGGTLGLLDTRQCSLLPGFLPTLPIGQTYLRDVIGPMVEGHETVFILLGTNDFTLESTIGTPNTQIFASRLILVGEYLVNERGVSEVILLGPMDKFDDLPGPANPYYLSDEVQFACWFYPWLVCGPNFQDVISFEHYDPTDGIHPNGAGHEVMAQEVLNYVPESSFQANMFIGTLIVILMKCRNSKWELKFAK